MYFQSLENNLTMMSETEILSWIELKWIELSRIIAIAQNIPKKFNALTCRAP